MAVIIVGNSPFFYHSCMKKITGTKLWANYALKWFLNEKLPKNQVLLQKMTDIGKYYQEMLDFKQKNRLVTFGTIYWAV